VVLIDTGPILGSVEAAVLAPAVDGAILTIAQGQNRWLARTALQRLRSLGVRTVGFVYNRAKAIDFHSSPFGSSAYSISVQSHASEGDASATDDANKSQLMPIRD
jgi:Mrp family chromosome partitioning ATPase